MSRPSKTKYYLDIAAAVAARSTCVRRQYGAIIVKNDMIISTGYNGSARGWIDCCDNGECWREAHGIPHGEQYEKCKAIHAEANAIISAARLDMMGSTLYLAGFENGERIAKPKPCEMCERMIDNAGIIKVISCEDDEIDAGLNYWFDYILKRRESKMRIKYNTPSDADLKVYKMIDHYMNGFGEMKHTARFIAKRIKQLCNKKLYLLSVFYKLNLFFEHPGPNYADRCDTLLAELNKIIPLSCPETGEFYGYKKCLHDDKNGNLCTCIVTLKIPNDAKRSSAFENKCRCDKAFVVKIEDNEGKELDYAFSYYDYSFEYHKGHLVQCQSLFNENRFVECGSGIHFFMTPEEAKNYIN